MKRIRLTSSAALCACLAVTLLLTAALFRLAAQTSAPSYDAFIAHNVARMSAMAETRSDSTRSEARLFGATPSSFTKQLPERRWAE